MNIFSYNRSRRPLNSFRISSLAVLLATVLTLFAPYTVFADTPTPQAAFCFSWTDNGGRKLTTCLPTQGDCEGAWAGRPEPKSGIGMCASPLVAPDPNVGALYQTNTAADVFKNLRVGNPLPGAGQLISDVGEKIISGISAGFGKMIEGIGWMIFTVAGFFLQSMAIIMDYSIKVSIDSNLLGGLMFLSVGWTAVRDVANMFFIFALLYIAIQTVLGLGSGNSKRWIAHIIITALLINFSLFFTKVIIDAGNIFAVAFWDKIQVQEGTNQINSASAKFLSGLDVQTIMSKHEAITGKKLDVKPFQQFMIYIGGAIIMFIAGYAFLAGAILMVSRTIHLIFLMVMSPFAFLAFGLPKLESYGSAWLGKLLGQTFVAPVFIFMLYLNSVLIDSTDLFALSGGAGEKFSSALIGDPAAFLIIFNFILLIGFLLASLHVAQSFGGGVASGAMNLSKRITGGMGGYALAGAAGLGGLGMREYYGRRAKQTLENKKLHELAGEDSHRGRVALRKIELAQERLNKTYDVRNTKLGGMMSGALGKVGINMGQGSKATYAKDGSVVAKTTAAMGRLPLGMGQQFGLSKTYGYVGEEERKRIIAEAEANPVFKDNPKAREMYLRERLGTEFGGIGPSGERETKDAFESGKNKDIRAKIEREKFTEQHMEALEGHVEAEKAAVEAGKTIGDDIIKGVRESMKRLNSSEIADLIKKPSYANSKTFVQNLSRQDLAAISRRDREKGEYDQITIKGKEGAPPPRFMDHVGRTIMSAEGKTPEESAHYHSTQHYIADKGREQLLGMDVDSYDTSASGAYQRNKKRIEEAQESRKNMLDDSHRTRTKDLNERLARKQSQLSSAPAAQKASIQKEIDDTKAEISKLNT